MTSFALMVLVVLAVGLVLLVIGLLFFRAALLGLEALMREGRTHTAILSQRVETKQGTAHATETGEPSGRVPLGDRNALGRL